MKTVLVVTVTCPDRPGIVERLTEVLGAHAANWEESRMARLGGDFAGIVKLSVPSDRADSLTMALRALATEQMTVVVKATQPEAAAAWAGYRLCDLRLTGADHEGIVHKVSAYLASQGVNVESMDTEVVCAPITATPLFQMAAHIQVPPGLAPTALNANLQRIAEELGVDITVEPASA
jgi:glycine cleavage system regulatory protein